MHILYCLLPDLSPKCIYYPQNAYISIVLDEKYPLIAYDYHQFGGEISPNCIYYPRIEVQISPDCIYYPRFEESTKYFQTAAPRIGQLEKSLTGTKVWQTERKIRDRDQVAVFEGRKEKVCRRLKTIDAISIQKIDIRVGMMPVL